MSNFKTKPFNLEEALAGKPVVTRDGRQVKKITKSDVNHTNPYSIYALLVTQTSNFNDVNEIIGSWTESGKYIASTSEENPLDLLMHIEEITIDNKLKIYREWTQSLILGAQEIYHYLDTIQSYIDFADYYHKTINTTDDNE